jgi:hypothetical protein
LANEIESPEMESVIYNSEEHDFLNGAGEESATGKACGLYRQGESNGFEVDFFAWIQECSLFGFWRGAGTCPARTNRAAYPRAQGAHHFV